MGVYVPSMEIPSGCPFCWLSNWERNSFLGCNAVIGKNRAVLTDKEYADSPAESRPEWCPLIPVSTPHGRLGDLDKLHDNMLSLTAGLEHRGEVMHEVRRAPTIIPAEEAQP